MFADVVDDGADRLAVDVRSVFGDLIKQAGHGVDELQSLMNQVVFVRDPLSHVRPEFVASV